jgi:hypothetical protein
LDKKLNEYQLKSYSVGVTTLEEVFLKIGEKGDSKNTNNLVKQSDVGPMSRESNEEGNLL